MGVGINRMVERNRIPLPSMGSESYGDWIDSYAKNITSGIRARRINRFVVLDEMVIETKEITVHTFQLGDVEDPDLYAAEPLYNWEKSDHGQWVMEHAMDTPAWYRATDPFNFGYQYAIRATFDTKTLTEYYLRFGNTTKKA